MKPHYLTPLFAPKAVAVVGASDTAGSIGQAIFSNILVSGYKGKLYPVNLNRKLVAGIAAVSSVRMIEGPVDLAVFATPVRTWPAVVKDCGKKGVKAVVLVKEFGDFEPLEAEVIEETVASARKYGIRVLGPNTLGLMRPIIGMNASNYAGRVKSGNLALVAQSSALCTAMLDWADAKGMGFSSVVSMGEGSDIDFGEILDYLVADHNTQGILIHTHHIHDARRFMSALRAAARSKPVVVIKSGRSDAHLNGITESSHLIDDADVFDMALARAGVLRVNTIAQLFTAARVLAANYRTQGGRIAIVTNGIGTGILAADSAISNGVPLAQLSPETLAQLDHEMPRDWSRGNPIDIIGDASPARFRTAVKVAAQDPNVDGILVIFTPQAGTDHLATAELMASLQKEIQKPLFMSWLGDARVAASREVFSREKIAHFRTPEFAIEVFRALAAFHHNQQLVLQTPGPLKEEATPPNIHAAHEIIETAMNQGREVLSEIESKMVLEAFHIPTNPARLARTADEAVELAQTFGYPVVLKIDSPDILYKSDVGGVELNIRTEIALRAMFSAIIERAREKMPNANINGIMVQPMVKRPYGRELMLGCTHDNTFGPVLTFGAGGIAAEALDDRKLSLPPLNDYLANSMIDGTRVNRILGSFKNMPAIDREALKATLLRVSEMVCELPAIYEMEINPLIADEQGILALDARIIVRAPQGNRRRYGHMAIMPYPTDLVEYMTLRDGTEVMIRPMRPEDADMQQEFVRSLSEESRFNRYMSSIKELSRPVLVRFTQLDYDREMALSMVATIEGKTQQLAASRYFMNPDNESCEFALVVGDDWQGRGIGVIMMERLFDAARQQGLKIMYGEVLANNKGMLKLMGKLGFKIDPHPEDRALTWVTKVLIED
ncbi:MAG: GNAT family N-acetyltransferase [Aquaspirillum sp.]